MTKIQPYCIDTEEALLGFLLSNPSKAPEVINLLEASSFYFPKHQAIYRAITDLVHKKKPSDITEVLLMINTSYTKQLAHVEIQAELARLTEKGFLVVSYNSLVERVKGLATKRTFISLALESIEQAYLPDTEIESIIQDFAESLLHLSDSLRKQENGLQPLRDVMIETIDDIEKLNDETIDPGDVQTGLYDLDQLIGGFQQKTLNIIAARPRIGKTTLSLALAINICLTGKHVAYFSLEMSNVQLSKKILANLIAGNLNTPPISAAELFRARGLKGLNDLSFLADATEKASEFNFWVDDYSSASSSYIRTEITKLAQRSKVPDVIFIDYVGLMSSASKHHNRVLELDNTLKELRAIAKDFNTVVVGLAQINRGVELRQDKRPGLADIRESGGYEQEAAVILGLHDPYVNSTDSNNPQVLDICVLKNRFGATGTVKIGFEPQYNRVKNLA